GHVVQQSVELGTHGGGVGLVVDRVQHGLDGGPHALGADAHEVRGVVGTAALPHRSGQVRGDGLDQAGVRVTGDQAHPGQAETTFIVAAAVPVIVGFLAIAVARYLYSTELANP